MYYILEKHKTTPNSLKNVVCVSLCTFSTIETILISTICRIAVYPLYCRARTHIRSGEGHGGDKTPGSKVTAAAISVACISQSGAAPLSLTCSQTG